MKKIYRLHRRLSLIIALPVVLSAGSGLLHPIMTNIRPAVATQGVSVLPIDSNVLRVSVEAALDSNHIDSVSRVRVVHIDSNWFYQIQRWGEDVPVYLSARNGHKLYQGDWLYAQWLARQFLEGPGGSAATAPAAGRPLVVNSPMNGMPMVAGGMESDCCNAATASVLNARGAKVVGAVRLTDFDEEYNEINRLMPVYRVAFDRPDGIRIYVETVQDRYSLAVDNRRAMFNRIFQYVHTYQWLGFLGSWKQVVEFLVIGLAFVTTLLGIYIFFSTKGGPVRPRRNHRYTAIVISLFTLAFTFSGAYHALSKLKAVPRRQYVARFGARGLRFDNRVFAGGRIGGIGLVDIENKRYWRLRLIGAAGPGAGAAGGAAGGAGATGGAGAAGGAAGGKKDLMRDMEASAPPVAYVAVGDSVVLPDREQRYARWLATQFSGKPVSEVVSTTLITRFDRDYNFTDKRLPVWRVAYPEDHHERYYVETSSGCLAARVDDLDLIESYSFALLHKHEFLGGLGKSVKDFSTMFWAAAQILLVGLGLVLYVKSRRKKRINGHG